MSIRNLDTLLRSMNPVLSPGEFVLCTIAPEELGTIKTTQPLMIFREKEGITIIVDKIAAIREGLSFTDVWSLITLAVHSDLSAVGFLAAVTSALAKEQIPVNAVSAFYHDHLFVPLEKTQAALRVLQDLAKNKS